MSLLRGISVASLSINAAIRVRMAECPSARKTPKAGKLSGPARARIISFRRFSFSGQNELPGNCPDKITSFGQAADTTKGGDFRCPHRSARGCDGSVRQDVGSGNDV